VPLGAHTITVCRDPDDNRILETAVIGGCDLIVSGDSDLLTLGSYQDIRIMRPADFLEFVE
jgi:predicted nucleic acid-binding protein